MIHTEECLYQIRQNHMCNWQLTHKGLNISWNVLQKNQHFCFSKRHHAFMQGKSVPFFSKTYLIHGNKFKREEDSSVYFFWAVNVDISCVSVSLNVFRRSLRSVWTIVFISWRIWRRRLLTFWRMMGRWLWHAGPIIPGEILLVSSAKTERKLGSGLLKC